MCHSTGGGAEWLGAFPPPSVPLGRRGRVRWGCGRCRSRSEARRVYAAYRRAGAAGQRPRASPRGAACVQVTGGFRWTRGPSFARWSWRPGSPRGLLGAFRSVTHRVTQSASDGCLWMRSGVRLRCPLMRKPQSPVPLLAFPLEVFAASQNFKQHRCFLTLCTVKLPVEWIESLCANCFGRAQDTLSDEAWPDPACRLAKEVKPSVVLGGFVVCLLGAFFSL